MPFSFLPLDGLSHTQLDAVVVREAGDTAGEDHEPLLRRRLMTADHAVEAGERDLDVAAGDARMREAV
jgi:hypothetical protein